MNRLTQEKLETLKLNMSGHRTPSNAYLALAVCELLEEIGALLGEQVALMKAISAKTDNLVPRPFYRTPE